MRPLRVSLNSLLLIAPLCLLGSGAFRYVQGTWAYLNSPKLLARVLSVEATRSLGREVKVGGIRIYGDLWNQDSANRVELQNISVEEDPTLSTKTFAQAEKVIVWYSLRQILSSADPTSPLIDRIQLVRPQLSLLHDSRGRWNFEPLIKPGAPAVRPFVGKISVLSGTLLYADQEFPHPAGISARPLITQIDNLSGVALFHADKSVSFDVASTGLPDITHDLHAVGIIEPKPLRVQAHLTAHQLALPFFGERFLSPKQATLVSGQADIELNALYEPSADASPRRFYPEALDTNGTVQIFQLTANTPKFGSPLSNLNGTTSFTNTSLLADLTGEFAGANVQLKGSLLSGVSGVGYRASGRHTGLPLHFFPSSPLHLSGSLKQADVARVVKALRLGPVLAKWPEEGRLRLLDARGQGDLTFEATGSSNNPTVTAQANFETLKTGRYFAEKVRLQGRYADKKLVADIRGKYASGEATIRTQVAFDPIGAFQVEVHGRDLEVGQVWAWPWKYVPHGKGHLDYAIRGQNGFTPNMTAQAKITNLKIHDQQFRSLYARAESVHRNLILKTVRLEDSRGFALANGKIDLKTGKMNLHIDADELDVEAIRKAAFPSPTPEKASEPGVIERLLPPEGVGYLRGAIVGTMAKPIFEGKLRILAGVPGDGVDKISTFVRLSQDHLTLENGTAQIYPGSVQVSRLEINPFVADSPINLILKVTNLETGEVLSLVGKDPATLPFQGTFSTSNVHLEGTLQNLRLHNPFTLSMPEATIQGVPISNILASIDYGQEGWHIQQAVGTTASGTLTAEGFIQEGKLNIEVTADSLNLETLALDTSSENSPDVEGTFQGQAHIEGTTEKPLVLAQVGITGLAVNGVDVGNVQGTVSYAEKQLFVPTLTLLDSGVKGGTGDSETPQKGQILFSNGLYDTETHHIEGKAEWSDLAIQRLRDLFQTSSYSTSEAGQKVTNLLNKITHPIEGKLSGTMAVSGKREEPRIQFTWDARNVSVNSHTVNALTGSAVWTPGKFVIPDPALPQQWAHLESPDAEINLENLSLVFANEEKKTKGEITGFLRVDKIDLSLLQNWVEGDTAKRLSGKGSFYVDATGELLSPTLEVSLNLKDVSYRAESKVYTLEDIRLDRATISEGKIKADTIQIAKQDKTGPTPQTFVVKAGGEVGFTWEPPFIPPDAVLNFHAGLKNQPLQILAAFAPSVLGDSEGTLSFEAGVAGTRANPKVSGKVSITAPRIRIGTQSGGKFSTGLRDVSGSLELQGDRVTVLPGFTARVQIIRPEGKGKGRDPKWTDPNLKGALLTLEGSLPLGLTEEAVTTTTTGGGIRLRTVKPSESTSLTPADRIYFEETQLPGTTSGAAQGAASLNLLLSGSVREPILGGEVTLSDALATLPRDFGNAQTTTPEYALDPRFDLRVRLGRNVKLANAQLDALTEGYFDLSGQLSSPRLQGELTLKEGKLILPTARFTILPPATLSLLYPVMELGQPSLGINVNLKAQTYLSAYSLGGIRRRYRVTVIAKGPLMSAETDSKTGEARLLLSFQTDPPDLAATPQALTERLAGLLGGVDSIRLLGSNPGSAIASQLTNVFTQSIIPGFFDRIATAGGFEELVFNYDPVQKFNLSVSRRLLGSLYVQYNRSLNASQELYNLKLSLRFRDKYQLSYETDEQRTQRILLEGIFRF